MSIFTLLAALVAGVGLARAALYPTQPTANTVFPAGQTVSIKWIDDGKTPSLTALPKMRLELLGNGDAVIGKIAPEVNPTDLSHEVWISPSLGKNSSDYYFRFISDDPPFQFYTSRFTLVNMVGPAALNASGAAASFNASYTGTVVPLIFTNSTPAIATQTSRSFSTSTIVASSAHSTITATPTPSGTGKDDQQQSSSGGRVDIEKMKFRLVFILWPALMGISMALLTSLATCLHERRDNAPAGFAKQGPAPADKVLRLRLVLKQTDIKGLQDALYNVSTPSSANYGQHLSKEEVFEYVAPTQESVQAVNSWLSENGLTAKTLSPAGDWLGFETTVEHANELFGAEFSTFVHEASGEESVRTLAYSGPASLKSHINLVHPTVTFPGPRRGVRLPIVSTPSTFAPAGNLSADAAPSSCSNSITPTCLQQLYGIPTKPATQSSNQIAVSGFIDQVANSADLKSFLGTYRKDLPSSNTFALETLDGGSNSQSKNQAGEEADLDVQYTIGLASSVPTVFISVGDNFQDGDLEGFLDIVNFLLAKDSPPQVLTTSYGDDESNISRELAESLCNAYAQLGARGTTILFTSGDGGVSGSQSQSCSTFIPTFPSGFPFLTSVGATAGARETAASLSAGGFSNYFGTPDYQVSAKSAFISQLGSTNRGKFNASGRGYPDVAAIGQAVDIVFQGSKVQAAGTSCSSPIFASVIALLNDQLVAAGKSPLGFLNPFLYSDAGVAALNDIKSGSNPGCRTYGFMAVSGWDPVTGLGTPNFAALQLAVGL